VAAVAVAAAAAALAAARSTTGATGGGTTGTGTTPAALTSAAVSKQEQGGQRRSTEASRLQDPRNRPLTTSNVSVFLYKRLNSDSEIGFSQLDSIVNHIKNGQCRNICFVTGAGISVSCGLPDYRSKGGLYDTLNPDLFTATQQQKDLMAQRPEFIVDIGLFKENPLPFWEYKRKWIIDTLESKLTPSFTHWFMYCCLKKNLLRRIYTQNIDGLEVSTGIPSTHLVQTHGNMQQVVCFYCEKLFPLLYLVEQLKKNIKDISEVDTTAPVSSSCFNCPECSRPGLKPSTVLFNEPMPAHFQRTIDSDFPEPCDLLIISGTSLKVEPVNTLVSLVKGTCPRLIVNNKMVGEDLGIRYTEPPVQDFYCGGDCDSGFAELARRLGWFDEIEEFRKDWRDRNI